MRIVKHLLASAILLCLAIGGPAPAAAQTGQELSGQVTDETGGALPGVQIVATHVDTGTTRETVTDGEGKYRVLGLRLGRYRIGAGLMGFAPATQEISLLLGQAPTLNLVLKLAAAQESILVTSQAPLVDQSRSDLALNVDLKQVENLPIAGRNWISMTTVAPGVRTTGQGMPTVGAMQQNKTKILVDGHQINDATNLNDTNMEFSQEAMQELKVVTNRMSAQYSRASGGIVNAVTKSGTNDLHGSGYYFLRDDTLNADDFFTQKREPFRSTDVGFTIGGPIVRNKVHYFANLEFRRQPRTQTIGTGIPVLDVTYDNSNETDLGLVNVDVELTSKHRVTGRYAFTRKSEHNQSVGEHLSNGWDFPKKSQAFGTKLVSVISGNAVNEFHFQYFPSNFRRDLNSEFPGLQFPSARLGTRTNSLYQNDERFTQARNDLTLNIGKHEIKVGGEYFYEDLKGVFGTFYHGEFLFQQNPTDWAAVVKVVEAQDRAGLQRLRDQGVIPVPTRSTFTLGDAGFDTPVHLIGGYLQDDWRIGSKVTLNVGLRYDIEIGAYLSESDLKTRFTTDYGAPRTDANNFAPRLGFAYNVTGGGRTVIRGGAGRYFDQINQNIIFAHQVFNGDTYAPIPVPYDATNPNFMVNPLGALTLDQVVNRNLAPADIRPMSRDLAANFTDQYAIGFGSNLTPTLAVQADFVHIVGQGEHLTVESNLFCNGGQVVPVAGAGRPDPRFGRIGLVTPRGRSRYEGLQTGVTRRYANGFQLQGSYTLSWAYADGSQWHIGGSTEPCNPNSVFGPSERDQRHRVVLNMVYDLPLGIQVGGLFYAASGQRFLTFAGRDLNGDNDNNDRARFADGTPRPRADGLSDPVYRLDLRLAKRVSFASRYHVDLVAQMFNVMNRKNYDPFLYQGNQSAANFLKPRRSTDLGFQPFQAQLGVRMSF